MRTSVSRLGRCGIFISGGTLLAASAGAAGQCPDPQWLVGPASAPSLQGTTRATLRWDPDGPGPHPEQLIAGGTLTAAGNSPVNNIAVYDPVLGWQPMGAGLTGEVRALALDNGSVYAGGVFGVARWTGSAWQPLGSLGTVEALISYQGQLIAGGAFGIESWDGSSWQVFHGNVSGTLQTGVVAFGVYALAMYGDDLIVGGQFAAAGGTPVNSIAGWNGSAWYSLGGGIWKPPTFNPNVGTTVYALTVSDGLLYIGGQFEGAGATTGPSSILVQSPNIIAWNGAGYEGLDGPCFSRWYWYRDVDVIGGQIDVAGQVPLVPFCGGDTTYYASRPVTGGTWVRSTPGPAASAQNIIEYDGDPVFDGRRVLRDGVLVDLTTGVSNEIADLASGGGSVYAAGPMSAGGQPTNGVARWDGTTWNSIGFSSAAGTNGPRVLAWYNNALYIGGDFATAAGQNTGGLVRYDGTGFSPVGGVVNGVVREMAVYNNTLVVGGSITSFGPLATPNIARWDGAAWSALGSGLSSPPTALAEHNGDLYAAGAFVPAHNLVKFDGSQWAPVTGGITGDVAALASYNGGLYAGGSITQAGSAVVSNIAVFNGSSWSDVGGGADNPVTELTVWNGRLYAAGTFIHAGLVTSPGIAAWNGSNWSSADGGLLEGDHANALAPYGNQLAVGGFIHGTSRGIAAWFAFLGCPPAACYANCDGSTAAPVLNVNDFVCFQNSFAAGDSYANCDGSTTQPVLNVNDFVCFQARFAAGCP